MAKDLIGEQQPQDNESQHNGHIPHPGGNTRLMVFRIEPFLLDRRQHVLRKQLTIDTVELCQQIWVVGHEFVFTIGHIYRLVRQVFHLMMIHQPLQRYCVPQHHSLLFVAHLAKRFDHIVIGDGIVAPSAFHHQVVAEAASMYHHLLVCQIFQGHRSWWIGLMEHHAMGEQLDSGLSIDSVLIVEIGIHAQHQIRVAVLQVLQSLLGGFQLDNIGNIQLLENHLQQLNVVAYRNTFLVQERIRPQVPCILIHQRTFFCKLSEISVPV